MNRVVIRTADVFPLSIVLLLRPGIEGLALLLVAHSTQETTKPMVSTRVSPGPTAIVGVSWSNRLIPETSPELKSAIPPYTSNTEQVLPVDAQVVVVNVPGAVVTVTFHPVPGQVPTCEAGLQKPAPSLTTSLDGLPE